MHSYIINTNDRDEKKIDAGRPLELVTSKEGEWKWIFFLSLSVKLSLPKVEVDHQLKNFFDKTQESILFQKRSLGRSLQNHDTWYF